MPKRTLPLSAAEVKEAKPKEKEYYLVDGNGLKLRIKPNGTKSWLFNYYKPFSNKRTNLGLGVYPNLSLANARIEAAKSRELLTQQIDPKDYRDELHAEKALNIKQTLEKVAESWFEVKKHKVSSDYAIDIWRSLELHIFPYLGKTPIAKITAPIVIEVVKVLENQGKLDTVKRLTQRLNEIMVFAVNTGLIYANPISDIKSAFKKATKTHNPSLKPNQLPELIDNLSNSNARIVTQLLVLWQLHTMTRPNEAAAAKWNEINFNNKIWTIPKERMKNRKTHEVPLTQQTLGILNQIKPYTGHREYIFPATHNFRQSINSQAANSLLKRIGFKNRTTAHGLRSLASTTLNEKGFSPDLIEKALAHTDKNSVRNAYNHADYISRRRKMMLWWSNYIENSTSKDHPRAKS
ncbi:tyrosine-type recombinase/integrase [Vibrio sp. Y2-5]|uniref:integrase domain-containing protein n=1 Tax=Vibrio sp. Y2-5 TaxID=2743977 RepID=UPI001660E511|nr:integrase domain-containing protein [Vibrio sp. Y2-5]MBD0788437.1 tyrosine-type recombinase/integrase [Vibrio sp. Y2-5]